MEEPRGAYVWLNLPASMILASWPSFWFAVARIFSSMGEAVISRRTRTSVVWPIRWARAMACKSICQSFGQHKAHPRIITVEFEGIDRVVDLISNLRVPVGVKQDHCVSRLEIQSLASSSR